VEDAERRILSVVQPLSLRLYKVKKIKAEFWPIINSSESAEKALRRAGWFAVFQGAITLTIVFIAISTQEPIGGIHGRNVIDVALIFFIAWRLFRYSLIWSVIAVVYEAANIYRNTLAGYGIESAIIGIIFLLVYIAGMRGADYLHSNRVKSLPEPTEDSPD
jgi:hypothetical protein